MQYELALHAAVCIQEKRDASTGVRYTWRQDVEQRLLRAAQLGHGEALRHLACMAEKTNSVAALDLMRRAANTGNVEALKSLIDSAVRTGSCDLADTYMHRMQCLETDLDCAYLRDPILPIRHRCSLCVRRDLACTYTCLYCQESFCRIHASNHEDHDHAPTVISLDADFLWLYGQGLTSIQPRRALVQFIQPAAGLRHPDALGALSWAHIDGALVAHPDLEMVFRWATDGHVRGSAIATSALGWCYIRGVAGHIRPDPERGVALWEEAAARNDPRALFELSRLVYLPQSGTMISDERMRQSAALGHPEALFVMACANNDDVMMHKACELGHVPALRHIVTSQPSNPMLALYKRKLVELGEDAIATHELVPYPRLMRPCAGCKRHIRPSTHSCAACQHTYCHAHGYVHQEDVGHALTVLSPHRAPAPLQPFSNISRASLQLLIQNAAQTQHLSVAALQAKQAAAQPSDTRLRPASEHFHLCLTATRLVARSTSLNACIHTLGLEAAAPETLLADHASSSVSGLPAASTLVTLGLLDTPRVRKAWAGLENHDSGMYTYMFFF